MVDSCQHPAVPTPTEGECIHRVLLVAGHNADANRIEELLAEVPERGFALVRAKSLVEAIVLLGNNDFDCVLLALGHDMESILKRYMQMAQHTVDLPVVIATTPQREESAKAAVLAGAMDYFLVGSMNAAKLAWSLENAVVNRDLQELTHDVRHEMRESARSIRLCQRCEEARSRRHVGAEPESFVLPWSAHSTHHVVCPDCARAMIRRAA